MPKKFYCELGYGNSAFISTEIEYDSGLEYRIPKWIVNSITSIYIRIWIGYRVYGISSSNGFFTREKNKCRYKFLIGIESKEV